MLPQNLAPQNKFHKIFYQSFDYHKTNSMSLMGDSLLEQSLKSSRRLEKRHNILNIDSDLHC